jgi:serine O-acetyltransferase
MKLFKNIREDVRYKAEDYYGSASLLNILKTLVTEGTIPVIVFRTANFFFKRRLFPIGWFFKVFNEIIFGLVIGPNATIGPGFSIAHSQGIVIHRSAVIGSHFRVQHQVTIGQRNHKVPIIGNNVFCGCGAKILGAITIGDNVKIGANAVVVHDFPSDCTVVGIPAKIVKKQKVLE